MRRKNSEKPFSSPEQERADEILQRMPSAFPPPTLAQQEDYVKRMIRRDRKAEHPKEYE